mgnify:CR=1 FL=1
MKVFYNRDQKRSIETCLTAAGTLAHKIKIVTPAASDGCKSWVFIRPFKLAEIKKNIGRNFELDSEYLLC